MDICTNSDSEVLYKANYRGLSETSHIAFRYNPQPRVCISPKLLWQTEQKSLQILIIFETLRSDNPNAGQIANMWQSRTRSLTLICSSSTPQAMTELTRIYSYYFTVLVISRWYTSIMLQTDRYADCWVPRRYSRYSRPGTDKAREKISYSSLFSHKPIS